MSGRRQGWTIAYRVGVVGLLVLIAWLVWEVRALVGFLH